MMPIPIAASLNISPSGKMNSFLNKGASVFEFFIIMLVVSFLILVSHYHHSKIEKRYEKTVVQQIAGVFSRIVTSISSAKSLHKQDQYILNNNIIYLTETGWPANTDSTLSSSSSSQTPEECMQLWYALLDDPAPVSIYSDTNPADISFYIYSINGNKCRYLYSNDLVNPLYFDYSLVNGSVVLSWDKEK